MSKGQLSLQHEVISTIDPGSGHNAWPMFVMSVLVSLSLCSVVVLSVVWLHQLFPHVCFVTVDSSQLYYLLLIVASMPSSCLSLHVCVLVSFVSVVSTSPQFQACLISILEDTLLKKKKIGGRLKAELKPFAVDRNQWKEISKVFMPFVTPPALLKLSL